MNYKEWREKQRGDIPDKDLRVYPEYLESGTLYCVTLKVRKGSIYDKKKQVQKDEKKSE